MERPIFNPHIKYSSDAYKKFKDKPKEVINGGGRMPTRRKNVQAEAANPNKVNKRRAKNKVASQSRKRNRG